MAHNHGYNNQYPPQNIVYNAPNAPPLPMNPPMPHRQVNQNPNYYPPQNTQYQPPPQPVQPPPHMMPPPPQPVQPPMPMQPPPVQPHMGMLIKQPSGRSLGGSQRNRGNSFKQPALPPGPPPAMNHKSSSKLHREPSKPRLPPGPPPDENYQKPLTRQKSRPVMPPPGPPPDETYRERQSRITRNTSGRVNPTLPPGPPPSPRGRSSSRPNIGDLRSRSQSNFGSRRRKGSFEAMPVLDSGRNGNSSRNLRNVGSSTRTARNLGSNRSAASKNTRSARKGSNRKNKKKPKKTKTKAIRKPKNKKGKGKKKNKGRGRSFSEIDCDNLEYDLRMDRAPSSRQVTYNSFTEEDPAMKKEAWSVQWSEDYQRPYYFNKVTGESLWEPPAEIMY